MQKNTLHASVIINFFFNLGIVRGASRIHNTIIYALAISIRWALRHRVYLADDKIMAAVAWHSGVDVCVVSFICENFH